MSLIFVFLVNVLLFNGYLSANIDLESIRHDVQQQNKSENGTDTSNTNASNDDFEYAMFDNSNLDEMLQFAKDSRYSEFVKKHIFPVKYRDYLFFVIPHDDQLIERRIELYAKSLNIFCYNFVLDIIKHFGGSIGKLNIYRSDLISDERSAIIHRYVNEYCSESLTYLNLGATHKNAFTQFQKPFSKLNELLLSIKTKQIEPIRPLDEIFPRLQRLKLFFYDYGTPTFDINGFIEAEIPYMKHLQFVDIEVCVGNRSDAAIIEIKIENMLQNNSQIRDLAYRNSLGSHTTKVINEYLPNLDIFTIHRFDLDIQPLRLDHVKHFIVDTNAPSPFERLSFPQLDSLSMKYCEDHKSGSGRESWIKFFENHQNVKTLNCSAYSDNGFVEFVSKLTNLNEIRLKCGLHFDINLFSRLIENRINLMKFQYQLNDYCNESETVIFRMKFENEWNISYSADGPTLTFERKN